MQNDFQNPDFDKLALDNISGKKKLLCASDESPLPLRRRLSDPAPYPLAALGEHLAPVAARLIEVVKAPDALCGQSILAAAALATQGLRDLDIDGRQFPLSEYLITIGETGERKSALDKIANDAARTREEELKSKHEVELGFFQNDTDIYKKQRDNLLKPGKSGKNLTREEMVRAMENLGPAPEAPLEPLLITEDPTYEGLVKLYAIGQPSMGLFSDEGGRMIGGYGMTEEQQLKTIAGLSQFWDGRRISRVRSGDGSMLLYGKRLSLHLMIQPIIANHLLGNPILSSQGFLSRCLFSWPDSTIGDRLYKDFDLSKDDIICEYKNRLLKIFRAPMQMRQNKRNEVNPSILKLEPNTKKDWIKFHDDIEVQLKDGKRYAPVKGLGAKIPEHALRLAGCLSVVNDLQVQSISPLAMDCGIALARYYVEEALRISHESSENPDLILAEKLLIWLGAQGSPLFYLANIYQFGPNPIRNAETAKRIVGILENHGWVIRRDPMKIT